MASIDEDLVTDSVPDPPRSQPSPNDRGSSSNSESENETETTGGKYRPSKKTTPPQEKPRRSSSSKPQHSFGPIPHINPPSGGASMICISNASNVHVGNSISINFVAHPFSQPRSSKSPSPEPRNAQKPKDVKEACKSTAHVTREDIDRVTEHVGKRWTKLGERLGYTEEQMERFHEDHNNMGLKEVVFQMLLDWKQFKGPEAQVGILCHCLWSARLYKAAEQLAALHS